MRFWNGLLACLLCGLAAAKRPATSFLHDMKPGSYEVVSVHSSSLQSFRERSMRTQSYGIQTAHPLQHDFHLTAFGEDIHITLEKNRNLFSPSYYEERVAYDEKGNKISSTKTAMSEDRHCFYKGQARSKSLGNALVAMSSCHDGFKGVILEWSGATNPTRLAVEPAHLHLELHEMQRHQRRLMDAAAFFPQSLGSDSLPPLEHLHVVFKIDGYDHHKALGTTPGDNWCGVRDHHEQSASPHAPHLQSAHASHASATHVHAVTDTGSSHPLLSLLSPLPKDGNKGKEFRPLAGIKTVELLIVNDRARFDQLGPLVEINSGDMANIVTALYTNNTFDPEVRVVLVAQITITTTDPWPQVMMGTEVGVDNLLTEFHKWGNTAGNTPPHDNRQLFSGLDFEGATLGYAGVGTMCIKQQTGGIDQVTIGRPDSFNSAVVAHEMGHNFGMQHDNDPANGCPTSGFIMNAVVGSVGPTQFSPCSKSYYLNWIQYQGASAACLNDVPATVWAYQPVCGNGVIEPGEGCDCGRSDSCATTSDPCCDATTCNFRVDVACTRADPCCTPQCTIVTYAAATECRPAVGGCDLPEFCSGLSAKCPPDRVKGTGTSCVEPEFSGEGLCYGGFCSTFRRQCRVDGNNFQGGPFDECKGTVLAPLPKGDDFCEQLQCQTAGSGSNPSVACAKLQTPDNKPILVNDGVPCKGTGDGAHQCKNGKCVASQSLNPNYFWQSGTWSACLTCDQPQQRPVQCRQKTNTGSVAESDDVCSPDVRPSSVRPCLNETLNCLVATRDNQLDSYARNIAERYGALDKAAALRNAMPRFSGYPTEFDTNDSRYAKGIQLLAFSGFFIAGLWVLIGVLVCLCGERYEKLVGGEEGKPQKGGAILPCIILLVGVSIMCLFAALAMFYNGELRRGATDPNIGAANLMQTGVNDALTLLNVISVPFLNINATASSTLAAAIPLLASVETRLADGPGTLTDAVATAASVVGGAATVHVQGQGTPPASNLTFTCAACAAASTAAASASSEIDSVAGETLAGMLNMSSQAKAFLGDAQFRLEVRDRQLIDNVLRRFNSVKAKTVKTKATVDLWSGRVKNYIKYIHPLTIVVCILPFVALVATSIGTCACRDSVETYVGSNGKLMFVIGFFVWLAFGGLLPLAAVSGDSCKWLTQAESNPAQYLELSPESAAIAQACLVNSSMVAAVNLTEFFAYRNLDLSYPAPDWNTVLAFPQLDALVTALAAVSNASFSGYDATMTDQKFVELNDLTAPDVWSRSNISSLDENAYPGNETQVNAARNEVRTWMAADVAVANAVTTIRAQSFALANAKLALRNRAMDSYADVEEVRCPGGDCSAGVQSLIDSANTVYDNAYCGSLGDTYRLFKNSWCTILTTAFSFMALSCVVAGILAGPMAITSTITWKRIAWATQSGQMSKHVELSSLKVRRPMGPR